jgi:hypothetical protein
LEKKKKDQSFYDEVLPFLLLLVNVLGVSAEFGRDDDMLGHSVPCFHDDCGDCY